MAENWYVGKDGQRSGPFTSAQVQRMAAAGELRPTDMLWMEGMANWVQAHTVKGLFPAQPFAVAGPAVNPYAAPTARDITVDTSGGALKYAEFLPRVAAAILDGLISNLLVVIPAICIFVGVMGMSGRDGDSQATAMTIGNCFVQIVSILIGLAYYVVLETSPKQATFGKQLVGIKVTDLDGKRLTVGRAIGRYFAKIITGLTCGIGFLMPLFTERKQTLHDMIAGCLAVKK